MSCDKSNNLVTSTDPVQPNGVVASVLLSSRFDAHLLPPFWLEHECNQWQRSQEVEVVPTICLRHPTARNCLPPFCPIRRADVLAPSSTLRLVTRGSQALDFDSACFPSRASPARSIEVHVRRGGSLATEGCLLHRADLATSTSITATDHKDLRSSKFLTRAREPCGSAAGLRPFPDAQCSADPRRLPLCAPGCERGVKALRANRDRESGAGNHFLGLKLWFTMVHRFYV